MAKKRLSSFILLVIASWWSGVALAADPSDITLRTGILSGTFQGKDVSQGKFQTDVNVEAEYWLYRKSTEVWAFRIFLGNESNLGRTRYFGSGFGQRYFILSDGLFTQQQTAAGYVEVRPRWAPFIGWDLNLGQFLVLPVGATLASYATTLDGGASVGCRYFISKSISMDAVAGVAYGSSVLSTVSATMIMMRFLVGVGLSF